MRRRLLSLLPLLSLLGCPDRYRRPDDFSPDPAPFLKELHQRAQQIQALNAQLSVESWREGERLHFRQLLALQTPDKLRVEVLSPLDRPLMSLASDGEILSIYNLRTRRFYQGPTRSKSLSKQLSLPLKTQELLSLLRGAIPLIQHEKATLGWDTERGRYLLELQGRGERQLIRIEPQKRQVLKIQAWEAGRSRYSVSLAQYIDRGGLSFPQRLRFEAPDLRVDLEVEDLKLKPQLPLEIFQLAPPRGIQVEPLN